VLFAEVVEATRDVTVGKTIEIEMGADVFALDAGVATATVADPTAAMSAAGTVATSWAGFVCVGATYAVANCVVVLIPFVHCTTEHGRRFVPFTVKVNEAAPAATVVCEREIFDGARGDEGEIVNGSALERTPTLDT
jgi:hypothetical protein